MEFQIDMNQSANSGKEEEPEDKKFSNSTTAEVSMNIVFDAYDPSTLKKNHFTSKMLPRLMGLKACLFGEISSPMSKEFQFGLTKGLKSISESSESNKEEDIQIKQVQESATFCVRKEGCEDTKGKQFVINFEDFGEEKEKPIRSQEINVFLEVDPPQLDSPDPYQQEIEEGEDIYARINSGLKFKMSIQSGSSGYSKENLILDMTPDKPRKSSIHNINSSEKKVFSDMKNKLQVNNLNFSVNSRPSFLDRRTSVKDPCLEKGEDPNWEDLSINTNDLMNTDRLSDFSDKDKQSTLEELKILEGDSEKVLLLKELMREKTLKECELMVQVLKKFPFIYEGLLSRRKKNLLQKRKERLLRKQSPETFTYSTKKSRNQILYLYGYGYESEFY